MTPTLRGCTVVVTREQRGELGRLLDESGATVVHVPLIEVVDGDSDVLARAWSTEPDWVIVTSAAGSDRVGRELARRPDVRLAAVGTATAQRLEDLAGRPVDLVPQRQWAESLVEEFTRRVTSPCSVLVAQADRAGPTLVDGLRAAGHDVNAVVAYRTLLRRPDDGTLESIGDADAVIFASGSAASGFAEAIGADASHRLPPLVIAIGPTTATAAERAGLTVSHVASDHSLPGVVSTLADAWGASGSHT